MNRRFVLQGRLRVKVLHRKTCVYATCYVISYVTSCILRRVGKLKSHEVVRRFEDTCGKLGEKYGVMC